MKKLSVLFLFALLPMMASADETVEINGVWYALDAEQNSATVVKDPLKYAGDVVIPKQVTWKGETYDVTAIAAEAFSGCPSLVSVLIGDAVTTMGKRAFAYDNALVSVTIGDGLEAISESAFYQCKALKYVTIGNGVTSIGTSAFHDCISLSSVIIGSGIASLGVSAFYGCSSLSDVYCLAESVPSTESTSFDSRYQISALHVPGVAYNDYFTTIPWSNFASISAIHDDELVKCATPVISYANGKIAFSSATDDVEFKSFLKIEGSDAYTDAEILAPISYTVSVYAIKKACYRSDVATKTFTFSGSAALGDLNGDGKVDVKDHVKLSDIILNKK
jgi:hypothetical protein